MIGTTRSVTAAVIALAAILIGGCNSEPPSTADGEPRLSGEGDETVAIGGGRWERLHGPARRASGFQELVPVVAGHTVVVIAGVDYDQATVKGLIIDPASGRWSTTAASKLWWRYGYSAVAAGGHVILWGGCCGPAGRGRRADGAMYDVERDRWQALAPGPLGNRVSHTAVWTGEEMVVWGGISGSVGSGGRSPGLRADGAAYDPGTDSWRMIAPAPLSPRRSHVAVWTGEEMIVWAGSRPLAGEQEHLLYDGAAYDPERDEWRRLATTRLFGAPRGILGAGEEPDLEAEWTGKEMVIWSRYGGAAYDPGSDSWQRIPDPPPEIRRIPGGTTVWTDQELIVWGAAGSAGADINQGAAYDPETRRWRPLPDAPIPGRDRHAAIWTRQGMVVWGGCCRHSHYYATGAVYVPE